MVKKTSLDHIRMIVIGASAGGVDAFMKILPSLKPAPLSVAFVLHLPKTGENLIPSLIGPQCQFKIQEAHSGEKILDQTIYMAPPDYHLALEPNHTLSLSNEKPVNFSRPSIDILFDSAAYAYRDKLMGILLTGSNDDGARGLKCIQDQGGVTVVQDPKDSEFTAMPESALKLIKPDYVLSIDDISKLILKICSKDRNHAS